MKSASHYRALASLYRQQAAYNPAQCWHLLGQAERWEHLANRTWLPTLKNAPLTQAS